MIAAGVLTYELLHTAIGLESSTITAVAGSLVTAVLLHGMLFAGLPRSRGQMARERLVTVMIVVLLGAALYGALTAVSHRAHWTTATPAEWVAYASLNAIGVGVILHVAIGRRWPFATISARMMIRA